MLWGRGGRGGFYGDQAFQRTTPSETASFQRKPLYAGVNGYFPQPLRNGVIPTKIATREPFSCLRPNPTTFTMRDEVHRVEKLTMPLRVVLVHLRGEKNIDRYILSSRPIQRLSEPPRTVLHRHPIQPQKIINIFFLLHINQK